MGKKKALRLYFLMLDTPNGLVRVGATYPSRKLALEWKSFVSKANGGLSVVLESVLVERGENGEVTSSFKERMLQRYNVEVG